MFSLQMMSEMDHLQQEMDQIFRGLGFWEPVKVRAHAAKFKLRDAGEAFVVEAPLPGIDVEKLEINVLGRRLELRGESHTEEIPDAVVWHRRERSSGSFQQAFTLPAAIDADKVEAEYLNGILKISLPKAKSELPKKISVKSV